MIGNLTEAIILAGGKGTRLKSVLGDCPKAMAIIDNKPFLEWILLMLKNQGIKRVIISTGYLGEAIESYFGSNGNIGMEIEFIRDPFPLGTGGAVRNALHKTNSKSLLVVNGDSYFRFNLSRFFEIHHVSQAKVSIILVHSEDGSRYGYVKVNKEGQVLAFREKFLRKQSGLINSGVYLFEREIIKKIPKDKMISLETEIFPNLIGKGFYGVSCEGSFIDIGTPESFCRAEKALKNEFNYLLLKEKS